MKRLLLALLLPLLAAFRANVGDAPIELRGSEIRLGAPPLLVLSPTFRGRYGRVALALRAESWREARAGGAFRLVGLAAHRLVRVTFEIAGREGDPRVILSVRVRYRRDVDVEREVVELTATADSARALGRDLRPRPAPRGRSLTDPSTPKVVLFERAGRAASLLGDDDFDSMSLVRDGRRIRIGLEIDHAGNHPFRVYPCTRRHRARGAGIGRALGPGEKAPRSERLDPRGRRAGAEVVRRVAIHVGRTFAPLWRARVPFPFRAALVFVDHADQSSRARLDAVSFPSGGGGFAGRGLPFTKTLFLRSDRGPQLEAPAFGDLARRLAARGIEVAPHTITDRTDGRERVRRGLAAYRELGLGPATWVDHSPHTNCEALSNGGARPGGPWYVVDLLRTAGVRYAWSGRDLRTPGLNLLVPERPGERRHLFYPHPAVDDGEDPLWLFPTQWAFLERKELVRRYSDDRLAALVRERGVHLAHTYLDFHLPGNRLHERSVLVRRNGRYELARELDERLAVMARLRNEGKLWVTTIRDLGDHLRAAAGVRVAYEPGGAVRVANEGGRAVRGFQLLAPPGVELARVEGAPHRARVGPDGLALGLDLASGAAVTVRLDRSGSASAPAPRRR